ncbi:MAG TPA: TerB family tellurite resistance protein [Myxococcota bacterium]|nr:TerB family tellurite resistance protein [Myxococcota bacterium]
MSFLRWMGIGADAAPARTAGDTHSVRAISARLERLDPQLARYLAAFAYVLARGASADLTIAEAEAGEMRRIVAELANLAPDEADLVVEIARSQVRLLGGTENYVVTREFKNLATRVQRAQLLECLFAVAAADGTVSPAESAEIVAIAEELGFTRIEANAVRAKYRDRLSEFQKR